MRPTLLRTGAVLAAPVLGLGWFLLQPASGGGDIYLLRARSLLGGLPAGAVAPDFPGSSSWIAFLIAAGEWLWLHLGPNRGEATSVALDRCEPVVRMILPYLWSVLAAVVVLGAARLAPKLWGTSATPTQPASHGRAGLVASILAGVLAGGSITLSRGVSTLSPAVPGTLLLLWCTSRLLSARRVDERASDVSLEVGHGFRDGLPLGALWAWAPFAWPLGFLYLTTLHASRVKWTRAGSTVVTAVATALHFDVSRIVDVTSIPELSVHEWMREGGWTLHGVSLGSGSVIGSIAGRPEAAIAAAGALLFGLVSLRRRRGIAMWIAGSWILLRFVPALAGVRTSGAVQQVAEPLWFVATAALAARVPDALAPRPRWLYRAPLVGALVVLWVWTGAQSWREQRASSPQLVGAVIARELSDRRGPGDLCLAERAIPGGQTIGQTLVLPRDSRDPGRYDFVYWPRWYAGFRFVLLSTTQVRLNLERGSRAATHFYQQLASEGRLVAEFGDPADYRLYEIPATSPWRRALTREELSEIGSAPDLSAFLSQLGSLYAETDQRGAATAVFETGVRLDPGSDALANNLGSIYLLEKEWQEAAGVLQSALERRPDSPELLYNYARALFELQVYNRAEMLFRKALSLRPDFAAAHYELARCFLAEEKKPLAYAALERYLELLPQSPRRKEVEGVLASLRAQGVHSPGEGPAGIGIEPVPQTEEAPATGTPGAPS
ncbi:MAG: tetratricopeptide repeat protein [Candidatus Eisenbacteria bacterium]